MDKFCDASYTLHRLYVKECLTVLKDGDIPPTFTTCEITDYITEEGLWELKDLDRLITHLYGYHLFRNERRKKHFKDEVAKKFQKSP